MTKYQIACNFRLFYDESMGIDDHFGETFTFPVQNMKLLQHSVNTIAQNIMNHEPVLQLTLHTPFKYKRTYLLSFSDTIEQSYIQSTLEYKITNRQFQPQCCFHAFYSPPRLRRAGNIGLGVVRPSVRPSVCLSVRLSVRPLPPVSQRWLGRFS